MAQTVAHMPAQTVAYMPAAMPVVGAIQQPGMPAPKQNAWSTDLCDMFAEPGGAGRCLCALIFPGCAHGQMAAIAPTGSMICAGNCCGACCLWGFFGPLFTCLASGSLRAHYNIQGDTCDDIVAGGLTPCGIMQQHRELLIRGAGAPKVVYVMPPTIISAPAPMAMGQPMPVQQVYAQ